MFDTIIIGGGPAGLTAALYASRRSLKTLVITRDIGGQAAKTFDIENYPGIPHTTGPAFATTLKNQAENFGAKITFEDTKKIRQLAGKKSDHFEVETINNKYESKTIILALGKKPRDLEAKGEEEFKGKGVSYCATCDAPFFRNKTVAVIGGGNSALDAAVLCSGISKKVYLIYRGNSFSAEAVLVQKVQSAKNIEILFNEEVEEIKGENVVKSTILKSGKELEVDGIIVEVGYVVDRTLIKDLVDLTEKNQVIVTPNQETSVPGIYAAGDLTTTIYKQIVISAGEGAKAALSVYDYIQQKEGKKGIAGDWQKLNKK